ncbi:MAG: cellulase family glycosylhydrolase [Actinomycetota bacterium]
MRTRSRSLHVVAAVVAIAASLGVGRATPTPAIERIGHRGRWLTDARGRVVVFHGVNMVMKTPPYEPSSIGFGDDDAAFLEREGFNTVRLGVILKGLEPQPGPFDDAYLENIRSTIRVLGEHGIRVLVDFHQDMYNEHFDGEGLPDWMVRHDGLPAEPDGGFPANYFAMPALWRAYDHLWANDPGPRGIGLQDEYAAAWRHVAAAMRDEPAVFGYDIFNEPWPGSVWPTCLNPQGCPLFDATLTSFFSRIIAQIRTVDPTTMTFYETHPIFAGGADVHMPSTGDAFAGFSFHVYCLGSTVGLPPNLLGEASCPLGEDRPFDRAEAQSQRTGDALLLSEFGATDDVPTIARDLDAADRHVDSCQYWTYSGGDPCCPRPAEGVIIDPSKPPTPDNVKQAKLDALVRPYPRAVAGTPLSWGYDTASDTFTFAYGTDPRIHADTEVFVPAARHYAGGYVVRVSGPAVVTSAPGARILTLRATGRGNVTVVMVPA